MGSSESFSATASDIYGNVWDVTNSTTWTIDAHAAGSWSGNTYTPRYSGVWTVTGTYRGMFDIASLTVTHGSPVSLVIGSTVSSTTAGSNVTYTATAFDYVGNSWDVSNAIIWNISSGANGSWNSNVYSCYSAGNWKVTGNLQGLTAAASLTVSPASPVSIMLAPKTSTLTAGSSEGFTATAIDNYGNNWDVSASTIWSISAGASGSWTGNVYTSAKANPWIVIGSLGTLSDAAMLTVTHGMATVLSLNQQSSAICAGSTQTFTTTASDIFGNSWDSTASATLNIDPQASGLLSGNVYTSCNAGIWEVTARCFGLTDVVSLTVTHASPVSIDIGPDSATVSAGSDQSYNATASDAYGNIWDVTSMTVWNVSSSAGGSWNNNNYNTEFAGCWIVTGTYSNLSNFVYLTVYHSSAVNIAISPNSAAMTLGSNEAFQPQLSINMATSGTLVIWQAGL